MNRTQAMTEDELVEGFFLHKNNIKNFIREISPECASQLLRQIYEIELLLLNKTRRSGEYEAVSPLPTGGAIS